MPRLHGRLRRSRRLSLSWIGSSGYLSAAYTEQRSEYGLPGHSHGYESCQPHASSLHCDGHDQPGPIGGWRATCSKPWRATLAKIYAPNCTS
ncbi:hypothetical protein ABE444_07470 [Brevundimonas pondensis]|uniref:hypothetical protein n=1 Tax=Brevundimonas pondensis TaxID=2774189 RepID=UPI00320B1FCF